jgi:hypothetical protein
MLVELNRIVAIKTEPACSFRYEYDRPRRDTRHDLNTATTSTNIPNSLGRVELDLFCSAAIGNADSIYHKKAMQGLYHVP